MFDLLYDERAALMDKKYKGGLSAEEDDRLSAVNSELDTLEMQRSAPAFARLEALVLTYEARAAQVRALLHDVKET